MTAISNLEIECGTAGQEIISADLLGNVASVSEVGDRPFTSLFDDRSNFLCVRLAQVDCE